MTGIVCLTHQRVIFIGGYIEIVVVDGVLVRALESHLIVQVGTG